MASIDADNWLSLIDWSSFFNAFFDRRQLAFFDRRASDAFFDQRQHAFILFFVLPLSQRVKLEREGGFWFAGFFFLC
ncbi:hypothetical protein RHGRI_008407 [Rhododendron griersonianum]|uniref:Uncharacterized protein n=1 Tax=Rhododendron griersonianum TaxID=479676 RepID=A0AAV6L2J3_9ERIC|nr:hypothetical protein RHGRI_008407 [Rhododendron griersonianum]